jgi:hypothetical protein
VRLLHLLLLAQLLFTAGPVSAEPRAHVCCTSAVTGPLLLAKQLLDLLYLALLLLLLHSLLLLLLHSLLLLFTAAPVSAGLRTPASCSLCSCAAPAADHSSPCLRRSSYTRLLYTLPLASSNSSSISGLNPPV